MIDYAKEEQAMSLAKIKYPEAPYAALWGTISVFITAEQLEKVIQALEAK
jgi:hypothetical protein